MIDLWLGLNLMDLATTLSALELGCTEGNPIMASLGSTELVVYKIGLSLGVLELLSQWKKLHLLRWLCVGMGIAAIWNLILVEVAI